MKTIYSVFYWIGRSLNFIFAIISKCSLEIPVNIMKNIALGLGHGLENKYLTELAETINTKFFVMTILFTTYGVGMTFIFIELFRR